MRKTKKDWLEAGLTLLHEKGFLNLTIDELTLRLGITKGSFYHHFKNYDDFKENLLAFFEERGTLQIIEQANTGQKPLEKLELILKSKLGYPPELEVTVRAWALHDPLVRRYQEKIDAQRLQYTQELLYALLQDENSAHQLALMFLTLYVGSQQIQPPLPEKTVQKLLYELIKIYHLPEREIQR